MLKDEGNVQHEKHGGKQSGEAVTAVLTCDADAKTGADAEGGAAMRSSHAVYKRLEETL